MCFIVLKDFCFSFLSIISFASLYVSSIFLLLFPFFISQHFSPLVLSFLSQKFLFSVYHFFFWYFFSSLLVVALYVRSLLSLSFFHRFSVFYVTFQSANYFLYFYILSLSAIFATSQILIYSACYFSSPSDILFLCVISFLDLLYLFLLFLFSVIFLLELRYLVSVIPLIESPFSSLHVPSVHCLLVLFPE